MNPVPTRILLLFLLVAATALQGASAANAQAGAVKPTDGGPSGPVPVTLYFHLVGYEDFPINTQPPAEGFTLTPYEGLATATSDCLPEVPGVGLVSRERHSFYGYSSPSYVEYDRMEGGLPRIHSERGLSYDVEIDSASPWSVDWFLESQWTATSGQVDPNQVPAVTPGVMVKVTVRAGDSVAMEDRGYNEGPILAQGQSEPVTLAGPASDDLNAGKTTYLGTNQSAAGHWVTGFRIPLQVSAPTLPALTGYNVRIDVLLDNPACTDPSGQGSLMPNTVRLHSSALYRPAMRLAIRDPLAVTQLHPQFVGDELVVHAGLNSVWGNYDVDEMGDGVVLDLRGPAPYADANPPSLERTTFVQHTNPHHKHTEPIHVAYVWPYLDDQAPDGLYTVRVTAWNDQHTASITREATFEVGKTEDPDPPGIRGVPGLGPVLAVMGLLVAAFVARRRK